MNHDRIGSFARRALLVDDSNGDALLSQTNGRHQADGARSGAIAFGQGSQLDRYRRPVRYDVAFKLAANHWNGTISPQLVVKRIFDTPERFEDLRLALVAEWKAGPEDWSEFARGVFTELGVAEGGSWRSLVESETFLTALKEPMPLAA